MRPEVLCCCLLLMSSACGPGKVDGGDDLGEDSTDGGSTDGGDSDSGSSESDASSEDASSEDSSGPGSGFIPDLDTNGDIGPCDSFAQDCPEGEKCSPCSLDGDSFTDSAKCAVVIGDKPPGSPCTLSDWAGASDDCDEGSFCLSGADGGPGICHAFCQGSEGDPMCPVGETCLHVLEPFLALCTADCDVLLQDCPAGEFCYDLGRPGCAPSHRLNAVMEPCEQFNDCAPGLYCAPAIMAPSCTGDACCLPYCDQIDPDCAALPGSVCTALVDDMWDIDEPAVCMDPEGMAP